MNTFPPWKSEAAFYPQSCNFSKSVSLAFPSSRPSGLNSVQRVSADLHKSSALNSLTAFGVENLGLDSSILRFLWKTWQSPAWKVSPRLHSHFRFHSPLKSNLTQKIQNDQSTGSLWDYSHRKEHSLRPAPLATTFFFFFFFATTFLASPPERISMWKHAKAEILAWSSSISEWHPNFTEGFKFQDLPYCKSVEVSPLSAHC